MRWQQLSLRYFLAPILRVRSWCMSLSIEPPRTSQWTTGGICWSSLRLAEGIFLLGQPLPASIVIVCSWSSKYYVSPAIDPFSDHCDSSNKAQGPRSNTYSGPCPHKRYFSYFSCFGGVLAIFWVVRVFRSFSTVMQVSWHSFSFRGILVIPK